MSGRFEVDPDETSAAAAAVVVGSAFREKDPETSAADYCWADADRSAETAW